MSHFVAGGDLIDTEMADHEARIEALEWQVFVNQVRKDFMQDFIGICLY